jgi:hypothetical protein
MRARVVEMALLDGGKSRSLYRAVVDRGTERVELIVRQDVGHGPQHGTAFTMAREAAVLCALDGLGVRLPKIYALAPDGDAILMQRLDGVAAIPESRQQRDQIIASFCRNLAALPIL